MSNSRGGADGALILTPQDAKRLRQAYPDLHEWPESWQVELADIAIGQQIVQLLMPFLLYLLDQGLAKTTVRRHRDNIWSLGAEVIRRRYDDGELARQDVPAAVQELIGEDGGPLIWPRMTEAEQDSLDTSCRKLHRFMQELKAAPKSGGGKAALLKFQWVTGHEG